MAHLLDTMAFVGELPWHKLGVQLPGLATAAEMITAAGLGWTVKTEPVFDGDMRELEGYKLTRREDTNAVLGVVSDEYVPFQNGDAFKLADAITLDPNGPKYETAGAIMGGKRIWALARIQDWFEVLPGDNFGSYLLITSGHDGKNALRMMLTNIRVVCNNTLTAACSDEKRGVRLAHTSDVLTKADDVRMQLGLFLKEARESQELYKYLASQPLTSEYVDTTLKAMFGEKGTDAKRDRCGAQRAQVLRLMEEGLGTNIPGVKGTKWGLYNAITEYSDHIQGSTSIREGADDTKLQSMWFGGTIQKRKEQAIELLTRV